MAEPRVLIALIPWTVSISIDGVLGRFRLGTHAFAIVPGSHEIAVGLGMAFGSKARATVSVEAHETVRLRYRPWILGGKLEVEIPGARVRR